MYKVQCNFQNHKRARSSKALLSYSYVSFSISFFLTSTFLQNILFDLLIVYVSIFVSLIIKMLKLKLKDPLGLTLLRYLSFSLSVIL